MPRSPNPFLASAPDLIVLPENRKQQRRDDRIDIDAEHISRGAGVVERLHELAIEGVEDVVIAAFSMNSAMNRSRGS